MKDSSQFNDSESYRRYLLNRIIGVVGLVVHVGLLPLFLWLDIRPMAALNVLSLIAWGAGLALNERGRPFAAIVLYTVEMLAHAGAGCWWVGWGAGFQLYLMGAIPVSVFVHRMNARWIAIFTVGLSVLFGALYFLTVGHPPAAMPGWLMPVFFITNAAITFLALGITSYFFRTAALASEGRIQEIANTDALTGLPNRRRIRELADSVSRGIESGYCVAICDIDHFKIFNDTHGHDCGDMVLRKVAEVLRETLWQAGTVGRWGGEEFLIVTSGDAAAAALRLEGLRQAVERSAYEFEGHTLRITMTFGVVAARRDESADGVIKRADEALYRGKEGGRNCVVVG